MHVITTILLVVGMVSHLQAQIFPEVKKDPLDCLYGVVDSNGIWLIEPELDDTRAFCVDPSREWSCYQNDKVFPAWRMVRKNVLEQVCRKKAIWVL